MNLHQYAVWINKDQYFFKAYLVDSFIVYILESLKTLPNSFTSFWASFWVDG